MTKAMEGVLRTSELLSKIFSHTDKVSTGRSAQVCKAWSKLALKSLWSHMDNVRDLFSILAPIESDPESDGKLKFARNLNDNDWDIFNKYAHYVNTLVLPGRPNTLVALYQEVARTRTRLVLLPNLRYLKVDSDGDGVSGLYSTMFLHGDLQEIYIVGHFGPVLEELCNIIARRSPNITKLSMQAYWSALSIKWKLAPFVSSLKKLRQIRFDKFILTDTLFTTLSNLQDLEKITMFPISIVPGSPSNLVDFHPAIQEGAFSKLRVLEMSSNLDDAVSLFSGPFDSSAITDLRLVIDCPKSEGKYKKLFECISANCSSLVSLDIASERWDDRDPGSEVILLSIDLFRPLFKLITVECFTFSHPLPVALTDDGLAELTRSWTRLKVLSFNRGFYLFPCPLPKLSVLQHFALHCPNLESLELCVDTCSASIPELPLSKFRKLKELRVGYSPIKNPREVAIFLAQICSECDIWLDYDCLDDQEEKMWATVSNMVEMAVRVIRLDRKGQRQMQTSNLTPI